METVDWVFLHLHLDFKLYMYCFDTGSRQTSPTKNCIQWHLPSTPIHPPWTPLNDPFKCAHPNESQWKPCTVYGTKLVVSVSICNAVDNFHLQNGYIVRSLKKSLQKYTSCVHICQKTKKVIIHPCVCLPTPDNTMCSFPLNSFACFQGESDIHARTKDRTRHLNLLRENLMKVLKKPSAMNIELSEPISLLNIHDLGGVETLSTCLQARFTDVGRPSIVYH